jgi:hypothetical protein
MADNSSSHLNQFNPGAGTQCEGKCGDKCEGVKEPHNDDSSTLMSAIDILEAYGSYDDRG